jgi:hypothetical protein
MQDMAHERKGVVANTAPLKEDEKVWCKKGLLGKKVW